MRTVSFLPYVFLCLSVEARASSPNEALQLASKPRTRIIRVADGTPIISRLLPDDELVIVERDIIETPHVMAPVDRPLAEELDDRAAQADEIAVVEVARVHPFLVKNGSSINAQILFRVESIVTDRTPPMIKTPTPTIAFERPGGELTVGNVRVRAGSYFDYRPGQRYLLFLKIVSDQPYIIWAFQVDSDHRLAPPLAPTGLAATAPSSLYGERLETIIEELRRRQ